MKQIRNKKQEMKIKQLVSQSLLIECKKNLNKSRDSILFLHVKDIWLLMSLAQSNHKGSIVVKFVSRHEKVFAEDMRE